MHDGASHAAAGVLRDVPVLDARVSTCIRIRAGSVVWVSGYIADGEDIVIKPRDGEVFGRLDRAVFLKRDGGVITEEVSGRTDADA